MYGNVVGVVVAKLDALRIASALDDIPQNVNFAIKSAVAKKFLDSQAIRYSTAGITWREMSAPDVAEKAKSASIEITCQH
jgi:serine protease Do